MSIKSGTFVGVPSTHWTARLADSHEIWQAGLKICRFRQTMSARSGRSILADAASRVEPAGEEVGELLVPALVERRGVGQRQEGQGLLDRDVARAFATIVTPISDS